MSEPEKPRRLGPREIVLAVAMAVWVFAVARTEPAAPLTPPIVSYAAAR